MQNFPFLGHVFFQRNGISEPLLNMMRIHAEPATENVKAARVAEGPPQNRCAETPFTRRNNSPGMTGSVISDYELLPSTNLAKQPVCG
jgi:hypothetical protein